MKVCANKKCEDTRRPRCAQQEKRRTSFTHQHFPMILYIIFISFWRKSFKLDEFVKNNWENESTKHFRNQIILKLRRESRKQQCTGICTGMLPWSKNMHQIVAPVLKYISVCCSGVALWWPMNFYLDNWHVTNYHSYIF